MKVYVKKTETKFGYESLYKTIKVSFIKIFFRKIKKWFYTHELMLLILTSVMLVSATVLLSYLIYITRGLYGF